MMPASYTDAIDAAARSALEFTDLYGCERMFPACMEFVEVTLGRMYGVETARVERDIKAQVGFLRDERGRQGG